MEAVLVARSKNKVILPLSLLLIHQQNNIPGFIAFKDGMILLLGGNIAGLKLKLFLIYRSKNAWAFKIAKKHTQCRSAVVYQ